MPRYYFDLVDGFVTVLDKSGTDLPELEAARREALITLGETARDPRTPLFMDIRADRAPYGPVLCTVKLEAED